jgi:fluoride exporter
MTADADHAAAHTDLPDDPDAGPLSPSLVGLVGLGGVLGTAARYAVATRWLPAGSGFPRGTLLVNLVGTFVLGLLLEALARSGPDLGRRRQLRLLVGTGFCGGLTTYSTLAVEADLLIRAHRDGLAVTYALTTVVAGLAIAGLGVAVGACRTRRTA